MIEVTYTHCAMRRCIDYCERGLLFACSLLLLHLSPSLVILSPCRSATGMGGMCWLFCALLAAHCCVNISLLPAPPSVWPSFFPQGRTLTLSTAQKHSQPCSSPSHGHVCPQVTLVLSILAWHIFWPVLHTVFWLFNSHDFSQQVAGLLFPSPIFNFITLVYDLCMPCLSWLFKIMRNGI